MFRLKKTWIILFFGTVIGALSGLNPYGLTIPVIFLILGFAVLTSLVLSYEREDANFLLKLISLALSVRVGLCLLLYSISNALKGHGFFLGKDDRAFNISAMRILDIWMQTGEIPANGSLQWMAKAGRVDYPYFITYIYFIVEKNPLIPLFINCLSGVFTAFLVYSITRLIFNIRAARIAAILVAFWPSLVLWSTQNLKDPLTILVIYLTFWSLIMMKYRFNLALLMVFITSFYSLKVLRVNLFLVFCFILAFSSGLYFLLKANRFILRTLVILVIVLFLCNFLNLKAGIIHKIGLNWGASGNTFSTLIKVVETIRINKQVSAQSLYLTSFNLTDPFQFWLFVPLSLFYSFFAPLPWDLTSSGQLPGVIEMILWALLLPFTFSGLKYAIGLLETKRELFYIFLFLLIMFFVLVFFEGNFGTLFRHRSLIWPFLLIFPAVGFINLKPKIKVTNPLNGRC